MNFAFRLIALAIMLPPSVIGLYRWYEFNQVTKSVARHQDAIKRYQHSPAFKQALERQRQRRARYAERRRELQLRRDRMKLRNNRNTHRATRRANRYRSKRTVVVRH